MRTNKLTEAAMFSALFVVISIIILSTGVAYSTYLVAGVPIITALIYFKCEIKYTVMSLLCAVVIIGFVVGDISSAVFMIQGIVIGLICAYFLCSEVNIYDSMLFSCIFSCIFMIFIDLTFSMLLGVSFIEEFKKDVQFIPVSSSLQNVFYYVLSISLPIGTVICTFLGTLLFGKRLKVLNLNGRNKFKIMSNFKLYISYLSCSKKAIIGCIAYLMVFSALDYFGIDLEFNNFGIILYMIRYVIVYFVIEDCFGFIFKYTYQKLQSKAIVNIAQIIIICLLVINFKLTLSALIIVNFLINKKFKLRDKQKFKLENILLVQKV